MDKVLFELLRKISKYLCDNEEKLTSNKKDLKEFNSIIVLIMGTLSYLNPEAKKIIESTLKKYAKKK